MLGGIILLLSLVAVVCSGRAEHAHGTGRTWTRGGPYCWSCNRWTALGNCNGKKAGGTGLIGSLCHGTWTALRVAKVLGCGSLPALGGKEAVQDCCLNFEGHRVRCTRAHCGPIWYKGAVEAARVEIAYGMCCVPNWPLPTSCNVVLS